MKRLFSSFRELFFISCRPWLLLRKHLMEKELDASPFGQFELWYNKAKRSLMEEFPGAMCLSTVDSEGCPDARMVLLKGFDSRGFVFYTNTESAKGVELAKHPRAAITFYWGSMQRQVRIRGAVQPVSNEEADKYFASRPHASKLGAWASMQSRLLSSRKELEDRFCEFSDRYRDGDVPRPLYWSGYRIVPESFEFWQLRLSRLHDRFRYRKNDAGGWIIERLYP